MDTTLFLELHIFLSTIYGGLIAGFIYDIYRTIRYFSKPRKFLTYLGDLLFWTLTASIFFIILIRNNWGEIRGYTLIGFFLGIFLYNKIFSRFIYPLCLKLGRVIKEFVKSVLSIVFYPFRILKKTSPLFKKFKRIPVEIYREIKKHKKIISSKK